MSFILDALKKADAERNLGHLPGIHTRQTIEAALPVVHSAWRSRHVTVVMLCGAAAGVIAIGAWQLGIGRHAELVVGAPGLVAPAALPETIPAKLPAQPAAAPVATVATELPVPKARVALRKAPSIPAPTNVAAPPARRTLPERANVMTLADLPPAIQREIPPLAISGSMYSTNPADRMLLVDKRMLHEGDEVAPGLVLDSVLPKGAILRYKNHVFRVTN